MNQGASHRQEATLRHAGKNGAADAEERRDSSQSFAES